MVKTKRDEILERWHAKPDLCECCNEICLPYVFVRDVSDCWDALCVNCWASACTAAAAELAREDASEST